MENPKNGLEITVSKNSEMFFIITGCEAKRGLGGGGGVFEFANCAMGEWAVRLLSRWVVN